MTYDEDDLSVCAMESKKNSDVKSKRRWFNQTSHLLPHPEEAEHISVREVAEGANNTGFGQAHSASVSESKLPEESLPYLSSSLDADLEMYSKNRVRICCAQANESKKEAHVLGEAYNNTHLNCEVCSGGRESYLSEDSQLEYLSAHEQDFNDEDSPSEFSEQREAVGTKTLKQINPVQEIPGDGVTKEQNILEVSEDSSPASECGVSVCTCTGAATTKLFHLLQECTDLICDFQEKQMEYHSAICGSTLENHSCGNIKRVCPNLLAFDSSENREVKGIPLTDSAQPPLMAAGAVAEHSDRHVRSTSVRRDNPLLSPRKRIPAEAVQFHVNARDCSFYSCEESGMCMCGTICADCAMKDAESWYPVSEMLTGKNLSFGVEDAGESSCGKSSCLNSEHRGNLKNKTGDSTIHQAVDVGSDFRACFTTSRSISTQVCLSSRAINTELTMMNKSQPVGWLCETCAGVARSADWLHGAENTEEIESQLSDTVEELSDGNAATAVGSTNVEDQHEWCGSNLKIRTDRLVQPDKQAVKDSTPSYCQKILQRAVEAELQLLNAHYKMCYQHCLKIYKLSLEENICFHRCNGSAELDSSLILVLEELKKNYNSMRMKIRMGTPLSALPPLSVEIELFPISSSYVPCEVLSQDICYDSVSVTRKAYFEAPKWNERNISVNMANPQTVCFIDGHQPSDPPSSKTSVEQHNDQDVECGCVKTEERSEGLTVADSSVKPEETKKQQEKRDRVDVREAKITESGNECSFIRVGGLSSSVSEAELRSHFQKYQIADIFICVASSNYRYSFLCFKEMNQAQLAVEEMNQKEIKGKAISVELVNDSSENTSLVSEILKAKLQHEIQPIDNSQINDQDKALVSASSAAKALDATSASEKVHLHPSTSSDISSTQVPSETNCLGLKSPTEDLNIGENLQQKIPSPFSTSSYDAFVSPSTMNLSSFTKLMNKLQEIHPAASSDKIVAALLEVKKNNKGVLSGLSINSIVERTSAVLKKSTTSCEWEKECK